MRSMTTARMRVVSLTSAMDRPAPSRAVASALPTVTPSPHPHRAVTER
jgi:hypothetical protein